MAEIIYIVKKNFDYGSRHYKPGDIFEPGSSRRDELICANLCREKRVNEKESTKKRRPKAEEVNDGN